jgi:hemolysin activation/secretion protein
MNGGKTERPWYVVASSLAFCLMTLVAQPVQAQVPLPPIFDPGGRSKEGPPLRREEPLKPNPPPLNPTQPAPPAETQERLPVVRVFVREYRFSGHSMFTTEELKSMAASYVNREVTTEDLESLRNQVTLLYIQRGYVTSGAILPDQAVTDGVVAIQVIEGKLSQISVEGAQWLWPSYYQRRLALSAGPPVNIYNLQERLQLLQQDPRVERINAELRRGAVSGESELNVRVSEHRPFKAWLDYDNYQPPAVRAERALATIAHDSLTGNGDRFRLTYGQSIPMNNTTGVFPLIDTSYSVPFTSYDTTFTVAYRRTDFEVVSAPFRALDIKGHIEIFSFTLQQPVYRTLNHNVVLGVQGEYLYNKNSLLGQGFPFFSGYTQNGVANVASLRFLQEWTYRAQNTVIGARSRLSVGLDVLDATINSGPVADGQYFSWLGQFQVLHRFDEWAGAQLLGRIDMQIANDRLLPLEQIPIGGRYSVRGYREISLLRDNAFLFSIEPRMPISRWLWDGREDLLQLAPFFDYSRAWAAKGSTENPVDLMSVGAGLRTSFLPDNRGYFEVYWGYRLRGSGTNDPPYNTNGNLQDHGVHLQLVLQIL